jgi:hypothetical protein
MRSRVTVTFVAEAALLYACAPSCSYSDRQHSCGVALIRQQARQAVYFSSFFPCFLELGGIVRLYRRGSPPRQRIFIFGVQNLPFDTVVCTTWSGELCLCVDHSRSGRPLGSRTNEKGNSPGLDAFGRDISAARRVRRLEEVRDKQAKAGCCLPTACRKVDCQKLSFASRAT